MPKSQCILKPREDYLLDRAKRLSGRRKAVTFIAGFKCFNGVVLCADSEESDGFKKKNVNKIFQKNLGEWGIAIAGAGRGGVIDSYWNKLHGDFEGHIYDRSWIEETVERSLKQMLKAHGKRDEYFRIGLGTFDVESKGTYLYLSDGHCLAPVNDFFCIGTGDDTLANFFCKTIYDKLMSAEEAARLGVFVTALSKSHADGVGGPTAAVLGLNSESTWKCYQPEDIAGIERTLSLFELESSLQEFWNQRNREVRKTSVFRNLEREQKKC
jgi:20S proteasome alpha/beta subunit